MTRDALMQQITNDLKDDNFAAHLFTHTWNSKTGRCTSFALKVSKNLEHSRPGGTYKFRLYDMGRHRLSRCENTFIVADSSSLRGAIVVPPKAEWTTFCDTALKWRWADRDSSTTKQVTGSTSRPQPIKTGKGPICDTQAMARCLSEVAADTVLITLFRCVSSIENTLPRFHGMIKWILDDPKEKVGSKEKRKYLILQPDLGNRHYFFYIEWRKGGTLDSCDRCWQFLVDFVQEWGGPHSTIQREADGGNMIHSMVWDSLVRNYGYPVLEGYGTPE
ncbi:hypothetical protein N0V84_010412 [Fusarium piperis]|uniref:Uncharacterized protein n=1 Tax=Fusarium piperis TaxID=1435070 RepID=A0A9W8TFP9_9HYPO|nr:hypothetical protein N0V84_010412 [Fusarium piperis]